MPPNVQALSRYAYQTALSLLLAVPPECLLEIWLEDRLVGPERATLAPDKNRDAKASMLIGAEVEPGLYKFRLWQPAPLCRTRTPPA
jgi:hypothetical protein